MALSFGRHANKLVKFMIQCSEEVMNMNSMDPNGKVKWIAKLVFKSNKRAMVLDQSYAFEAR